jgi:carbon-monoxide dehydrogenase large subunit
MIGERRQRTEDARFLTGKGRYVADLHDAETKHIAILRSGLAHARIVGIDTSKAEALPGVVATFTGEQLAAVSEPFDHLIPEAIAKPLTWPILATDRVRFVGEPIAAVVAESRAIAEDACELIELELEELPAVTDAEAALAPDAPLLYDEWGTNLFLNLTFENGSGDEAFANAPHVLRERFYNHRVQAVPLEGHGAIGHYDSGRGELTVWSSQQQPHQLRTVLADATRLPEKSIRVIAPDIGGGFGNKQHFFREEALVAVVAVQVPHRVSWIEDRVEGLTASVHSRDNAQDVEVAYDDGGRILAIRARITTDLGNPVLYFTGAAPSFVCAHYLTGAYDIQSYGFEIRAVATNKCPVGAYRGFGRPQALFAIERIMDLVADELGLDPVEVRRRNLIPDEPRPYRSAVGSRIDCGPLAPVLERAVAEIDYAGWRARQAALREEGRYVGVGFIANVEGGAPNLYGGARRFGAYEFAMTSVLPDGSVSVAVGTKSTGQGHETVLAQVAADVLTLPSDQVRVLEGDTHLLPYGMGTWGSRTAIMGGGAVIKATRQVRAKMIEIASHLLGGVCADDVTLEAGVFRADGQEVRFADVASVAYLHPQHLPRHIDIGLSAVASYDPRLTDEVPDEDGKGNGCMTYGGCATAAIVDVDVYTGRTTILDVVVVHDSGQVINPMIVEGQIQGGFSQGVGVTLLEEMAYGEDGQPLSATLLDYQVPCFGDVPRVRVVHETTLPDLVGPFRSVGELGIILAPAVIASAIHDALRPFGVTVRQTNLGAHRVRAMLRDAGVAFDPVAAAQRVAALPAPDTGHRVLVAS